MYPYAKHISVADHRLFSQHWELSFIIRLLNLVPQSVRFPKFP